jgi:hypothetical protein
MDGLEIFDCAGNWRLWMVFFWLSGTYGLCGKFAIQFLSQLSHLISRCLARTKNTSLPSSPYFFLF